MIFTKEQALERARAYWDDWYRAPDDGQVECLASMLLEAQAEALDWAWTLDCGVIFDEEAARLRATAAELRGE